jgi:hypothetical protein
MRYDWRGDKRLAIFVIARSEAGETEVRLLRDRRECFAVQSAGSIFIDGGGLS